MARLFFTLLFFVFMAASPAAQVPYSYEPDPQDPGQRYLLGSPTRQVLMHDTSFAWYAQNQKGYEPAPEIIAVLKKAKDSLSFVVFAGTWCDDSRFILPRFFLLMERAGVGDDRIRFFAVDRAKKTPDGSADAFAVERVPTLIILVSGKEIGRVVEYGKTGRWDQELADLVR